MSKTIVCETKQGIKQDEISKAMKELTSAGFRLYSYLENMVELDGGYTVFQLSAKDVCTFTGFSERTYHLAVKNLISHDYLKPKKGKKNCFLFDGKARD